MPGIEETKIKYSQGHLFEQLDEFGASIGVIDEAVQFPFDTYRKIRSSETLKSEIILEDDMDFIAISQRLMQSIKDVIMIFLAQERSIMPREIPLDPNHWREMPGIIIFLDARNVTLPEPVEEFFSLIDGMRTSLDVNADPFNVAKRIKILFFGKIEFIPDYVFNSTISISKY